MGKSLFIALLSLFFFSCIDFEQVEREPDTYDIYGHFLHTPTFAYVLTDSVTHLDSIPPAQLTVGDTWCYQYRYAGDDVTLSQEHSVQLTALVGNEAHFTINGSAFVVTLVGNAYVTTSETPLPYRLPVPHISDLLPAYETPCLFMEDGSYAYRVRDGIYSSTYGIIQKDNCLISFNGGALEPIGKQLNEFLEREDAWFQ